MFPVRKADQFIFCLFPVRDGYQVIQTGAGVFKVLKKGRIFLARELALEFLDKYIKQGTYKDDKLRSEVGGQENNN